MNELQKLYESLSSRGYYTKSFEEFQTQYQDPAYQDKVYSIVSRDGLYTKDKDSFISKYSASTTITPEETLKKKDEPVSTGLPSEGSSLGSSSEPKVEAKPIEVFQGFTPEQKKQMGEDTTSQSYMGMTASADQLKKDEKTTYAENLGTDLSVGINKLNKIIAQTPENLYDLASMPQNLVAWATGLDVSANSEKTKAALGIENPLLNLYKEEGKRLEGEVQKFNQENYKSSSIYENIKDGNYGDAFKLLGSSIIQNAPVSIAMMAGGATLTPMQLSAAGTVAFYGENADQLREDNPDASDIETNIKALTMSAAETVFSAIGEGQIGAVYRDIIKKEGVEAGTQIFKVGLTDMYKEAIKKYGIPVGVIGEGIEEAATQVTQNMVSGKPAFENVPDAFLQGGGSGAVFTAPITLKNAKDRIVNEVAKADDRKQINTILGNSEAKLSTLYDTPKDAPINEQQLSVASLSKSRDLLEKNLKQSVKNGEITQDQAKQSLYVFDKTQQIAGQLRNVDIDAPAKVTVANLLKEREALSDKIQGQDAALSVLEKERIDQINEEIKKTIIESKFNIQPDQPSYSINGKQMSEVDFTKALSEMPIEEVKKADIKATNASESATNLLKDIAARSGVESAPMMQTTAAAGIPEEISSLKDDEQITVTVKTLEEVPEQFRDRAEKKEGMKVQVGNKILGLPIGKKKETIVGEGYAYTLTGKEVKDYAAGRGREPIKLEPLTSDEVTFKGKRGQADNITFDGKTIKQGEEIELNNVNISQDDAMPDLRSGKYKVRMLSVDTNGKSATLTLTDGNEVITTTVKDLRKSQAGVAPAKQEEVEADLASVIKTRLREEGVSQEERNKLTGTRENPIITSATKADYESLLKSYKESKQKQLADFEEGGKEEGKFIPEKGIFISSDVSFYDNKIKAVEDLLGKPTEVKPIEQELAELEQMFPTEVETETKPTIINEPIVENIKQEKNDGSIPLDETVEPSKEGISHANTLGGVAYELPGGIGLVQGFNMFGSRLYSAYKNSSRTNIDIDNFDNSKGFFSDAEINSLKELKKKIEDKEKEKSFDNPFDKQGRIASSDGVPANIKEFVSALTEKLGVNKKIFIITDADLNEAQYQKHGLFGKLSAIRSAKLSAKDGAFGVKRYMSDADAYYIYYDGKLKGKELFTVISHELGHVIEVEKLNSASKETKSAIKDDYNKWIAKAEGKTVEEIEKETRDITIHHLLAKDKTPFDKSKHSYISSFSEYFADNVSKWTRTSEKPKTLVDKFFAELANTFKRVKNYLTNTGNYSENIFKWLDGMYESKEKDVVTKKTDNLEEAVPMKRQAQDDSSNVDNIVKQARASGYSEKAIEEFLKKRGVDQAIIEKSLAKIGAENEDLTLSKLEDKVFDAKKKIASSDDTDLAIKEYNKAKKERDDFVLSIQERKERERKSSNIETLLDEARIASEDSRYEYKDLYDKDPKLAVAQSIKDMIEFIESGDFEQALIKQGMPPDEAKEDAQRSLERNKADLADITSDAKKASTSGNKKAPSAKTITGQQKSKKITITEMQGLKEQIKNFARGFKEGRASVLDSVKAIRDFVIKNKDVANLSRKDLLKVVDIMKTVKDEKSFDRATEKLFGIIDNANKDIIEVSKTKIDKEKLKAELKAAKDGAKGVANKIKAVKDYFDSVKEYGNLTRKDLLKVMKQIASVKDAESLDKAINKINDIIDNAKTDKIEISELKMLKQTIKEVKLAKGNIKEKRKLIADIIAKFKKSGKLSAAKADALVKRVNNLNVENFEHLAKFIDYAEKTFADAEYQGKLSKANAIKAAIKKLSKNKGNKYDGGLVPLAKRFLAIDPSLVEDIDQYNKMASDIAEGVKGSSEKEFKPTVEIKAVDAYVEDAMEYQKDMLTEIMQSQVEDMLDIADADLTYDEMLELLQVKKQDISAQKEKIVRSMAIKLFDMYSTIIDHILSTGKDPFTGQDVEIKESKKDVVKRFMEMDLRNMDIKTAISAVDALNNFIVNGSTMKMEDTIRKYVGNENATKLQKLGIKAKKLKIYFNEWLGKFLNDQFATQPILFEELFGGQKSAEFVEREMGVTDLKSNKSKAQAMVNKMVADYTLKFLKTKPNGQDFNTAFNNVERGMLAHVLRTDPNNFQKSFDDNKSLIDQSIEALKNGDKNQQKKAEIYQEVFNKILKDSNNAQEAASKADGANVDAVTFWIEKWAENYDELADVAENIHNTVLGKDMLYTPVRVSNLGPEAGLKVEKEDDVDIMGSGFIQNSGVYKKKTGRLMESTIENKLPDNKYIDLSFDSNNANLMLDAMIDVKTAGDVRQIDAFLKSDAFKKIMPDVEERRLLQGRIDLMVRNFRNKNHYNYDEMAKLSKALNRVASLGASYALGSAGGVLKQTIPVAINTMANGGIPRFDVMFNQAMRDFINNSGESIANRGSESTAEVKSINSLLDKAAESTPEKAAQLIEKASGLWLKLFLQSPDLYIARASWMAYYEKSLKKQGLNTKNLDYSTLELNKEAAQYATRMVDRQQNISDADLKGRVFSSKEPLSHITSKVLLPFASFRINQWLRMNNDLGVATSKTSTKEDKALARRSLAGFAVEVAAFNAISLGLSYLTYGAAVAVLRDATGSDNDEEDKKKVEEIDDKYMSNLMKGKGSSVIQDVFSPIPLADPLLEWAAYYAIDAIQSFQDISEEERMNIFKPRWKQEGFKALGSLGIAAERTTNLIKIGHAWATGEVTTEAFGQSTTKNVRQRDKEVLGPLTTLAFINSLGALPTEFNSAQNTIFKEITKQASTKDEIEILKDKEKKAATKEKTEKKLNDIDKAIKQTNDQDVKDALIKMKKHIEEGTKPTDAEKEDEDRDDAKKLLRKIRSNKDGSKKRKSGFGSKRFGTKRFGSK